MIVDSGFGMIGWSFLMMVSVGEVYGKRKDTSPLAHAANPGPAINRMALRVRSLLYTSIASKRT